MSVATREHVAIIVNYICYCGYRKGVNAKLSKKYGINSGRITEIMTGQRFSEMTGFTSDDPKENIRQFNLKNTINRKLLMDEGLIKKGVLKKLTKQKKPEVQAVTNKITRKHVTDDEVKEIVKLYKSGIVEEDIMLMVKRSMSTVRRVLSPHFDYFHPITKFGKRKVYNEAVEMHVKRRLINRRKQTRK